MPEIVRASVSAAKIFVGPELKRVMGAADEYFSIEYAGDLGAVVQGAQGDSMHVGMDVNTFTMPIQVLPASSAVATILEARALTGNMFPIKVNFNDFSFVGWATLINAGAWTATTTPGARTMTLGLTYVSGNIGVGIGSIVQIG